MGRAGGFWICNQRLAEKNDTEAPESGAEEEPVPNAGRGGKG